MGRNGREYVRKNYRWDVIARQVRPDVRRRLADRAADGSFTRRRQTTSRLGFRLVGGALATTPLRRLLAARAGCRTA